jgi:amidase
VSASELMWKDVTEQAALVRSGEVSALELVDAAIARLEGARELNVLVNEQFDAARAAASGPLPDGPLAGVPFLLKDLGEPQAGIPEHMGSRALRDHVPSITALTVERYLAAGLIICGRTSTAEFGNHCATEPALFGRTLNPWKAELSPGGSSGGSAAAVAAGLIGAASGSDGTGSIRMPSSCCGLVGLKPRRARSSFAPAAGQGLDGLATKHALTRTVRDSALLLDVTAGSAPGDPYTAPSPTRPFVQEVGANTGRLRVMRLERPPFPGTPDPRIQAVADGAARTLEGLGHAIDSGLLSFEPEVMRRSISVIHAVDNASTFNWLLEYLGRPPEPDELDPVTWDMLNEGLELTAVDHRAAIDDLHAQSRLAARAFASADVLLCPTLNVLPPLPGALSSSRGTVDAFFDVEFESTGATTVPNVTGWPAITLPLGEVEGLPVGVQLIAQDEAVLIRLASQLEQALPWADRRPPSYA